MEYRGWTNFETWALSQWLMDEEQSKPLVEAVATGWRSLSLADLAGFLSTWSRERSDLPTSLRRSLGEIDWIQLAEANVSELLRQVNRRARALRRRDRLQRILSRLT